MLLLVVFCLFFNGISSKKSIHLDIIPDEKLHHWSLGHCKLPNTLVNISSDLAGVWYNRASIQLNPVKETINPFIVIYFTFDCQKFIITYNSDSKELEIEYSCLKPLFKAPKECQVFFKFGQNNRIIYPATNCPKAPKLEHVMIAYTDNFNYLVIVGCQEALASNQTIMHQNLSLVLSRSVGDLAPETLIEIRKKLDFDVIFYNFSKTNMTCTCEEFSCGAINSRCYPVRGQNSQSKSKLSLNAMKYSWIIWLLIGLVLFILFAILSIKGHSNNRVGVA